MAGVKKSGGTGRTAGAGKAGRTAGLKRGTARGKTTGGTKTSGTTKKTITKGTKGTKGKSAKAGVSSMTAKTAPKGTTKKTITKGTKVRTKGTTASKAGKAPMKMIEQPRAPERVIVRIRELDPYRKCGPGTSVERLIRVDEEVAGRTEAHLVYFDRHGWYCEHGRTCHAVKHARKGVSTTR